MKLKGDANVPSVDLKESEVNHLRQLLAWMRCEYTLDENMQRGYLNAANECVRHGIATPERAEELVGELATKINHVPKYVRQAVKMLTKALRDHEKRSKVIEAELSQATDALRTIAEFPDVPENMNSANMKLIAKRALGGKVSHN